MIKENRSHITPGQLKKWMDEKKDFILIDVLPGDYFIQKHIPDAINACVYEVSFNDQIKELARESSKPIVVYGERDGFLASASAFTKLSDAGYEKVYELVGGIAAWEKAGYEVECKDGKPKKDYGTPALHSDKKTLKVDTKKSKIRWTGRNLGNLHFGYIGLSKGSVEVNDGVVTGGNFTINMESIVCEDIADKAMNKMLVAHLCSADFFETSTYPEGKFTITEALRLEKASPGAPNYRITGNLTLKGITHSVEFEAVIGWNTEQKLFTQATFEIDRTKWKVMYGSGRFFERLGMHLVNDNITLQLFITAD